MASRQLDEEAIFHTARRIESTEVRSEYLNQICSGDAALRSRVEALLEVHEKEQDFLRSSPEPAPTVDQSPLIERPGTTIGRYRLMEQVGEGGMGVVLVAEQERPVRRKVALKIIKPGMDTKEVIARFEAERQALALMDHANIAKVFDAGSTESGRPYFVMELVRGIPITDYCDQARLSIRERLGLFLQVCQAIQHAHQKGIIHRDVKPSNVLVTLHDGQPVPKVIDFGVAKAINQRLTERTIYTRLTQIIGTPMYMSPEQAELSGLDVDTRSDVYSLGVLLYELLTGTTPFDQQRFDQAAYDEIRRIVREEEPPKPSTKISTLGETATSMSLRRGTDPHGLSRSIRGDLDVIVMKAIDKDRTRRYDTASAMAADVDRFLCDEPIVARAPSLAYRIAKFARRNRAAVAASTLVLASLVGGMAGTTAMALVAWEYAEKAQSKLDMLAKASYGEAVTAALAGDREKAETAMKVAKEGIDKIDIAVLEGLIELSRGDFVQAVKLADQALQDDTLTHDSRRIGPLALLAAATPWAGDIDRFEQAIAELRDLTPESDTEYMLKAYAMVLPDPETGLRLLKASPPSQHSTVGLLVRGQANLFMGIDQQDAGLLDSAVRDFEYVRFLSRDNQAPVAWRAYAIAAALELARHAENREEERRLTELGRRVAEELLQLRSNPMRDSLRCVVNRTIGELDDAIRASLDMASHPSAYCGYAASVLLEHYDPEIAARKYDEAVPDENKARKDFRFHRGLLAGAASQPAEMVHGLVEDLLDDPSDFQRKNAMYALCLVNTPNKIKELAGRAMRRGANSGRDEEGIFCPRTSVEYLAGEITESELLQRAARHGYRLAIAHCTIGLKRLAERNRAAAREHFAQAVATNTINSFDHALAQAFLARMDADPNWPSWTRADIDDSAKDPR